MGIVPREGESALPSLFARRKSEHEGEAIVAEMVGELVPR